MLAFFLILMQFLTVFFITGVVVNLENSMIMTQITKSSL